MVAITVAIPLWDVRTAAHVDRSISAADSTFVNGVAFTVAISFRYIATATIVNCAGAIANAAFVKFANAFVHIVANAIGIRVIFTRTSALTKGVFLVAVAIAVLLGNVCTAAPVDRSRAVANATAIQCANAFVHIVANAIGIRVIFTRTSALTKGIFLVAITVAVPYRDVGAAALVDRSRAVANATVIWCANAFVHIVANAIGIHVLGAIATAYTQCIQLVAFAVAIPFWDCITTARKYSTRSIANPAFIQRTNAFVHIVANAVGIRVIFTRTSALTKGVFLVAVAIAILLGNVCTAALVDRSRAVANATAI